MSVVFPSMLWGAQGTHSVNLYDYAVPGFGGTADVTDPINGVATFHGLVSEIPKTLTGSLWNAVNWTLYNHIIIEPSSIDVGNVLSNIGRVVTVWNGFSFPVDVTNFVAINAEGINVTTANDPPYVLGALQVATYTLEITTDGPSNINATFVWTIEGVEYSLSVIGKRSFVFPFSPNYKYDVIESLEWKTNVMRSYNGTEQRRAIRTKPRRTFEYTLSRFKGDAQLLQSMLIGWQNRVFALPVWTDKVVLQVDQAAGDTVVLVNPTNYSFSAGKSLIMYLSPTEFEVADILSMSSTITLVRALEKAWPKGTAVYPVIEAHLPKSTSIRRLTDSVLEGRVTFETNPADTDPYIPTGGTFPTYAGTELITAQPNWEGGLNGTFDFAFNTLDYETGAIGWLASEDYSTNSRPYSWLFADRTSITEFRRFLGRRRGMVKTCWAPTWNDDFTVVANIAPSDTSIIVADNGYADLVQANAAHNRIMIRTSGDQKYYRQILDSVKGPGANQITLTLDSPLGTAYTAKQVQAVHYLQLCRLMSDKITIQWKANATAIVETMFFTVTE